MKALQYYTYVDFQKTNCYLELNEEFYCERVIYASKFELEVSWYDVENHPYAMPDACFKDTVENMKSMSEAEFDTLWFQNDKVFKEAKAVFRYANVKRK